MVRINNILKYKIQIVWKSKKTNLVRILTDEPVNIISTVYDVKNIMWARQEFHVLRFETDQATCSTPVCW